MYKILETATLNHEGESAQCEHINDEGDLYWFGVCTTINGDFLVFVASDLEKLKEEFMISLEENVDGY